MAKRSFDNYRTVVNLLKKECKTDLPLRVRRVQMPRDAYGDCDKKDDHYLIRVSKNLPEYFAIDVLIHEVAHALAWNTKQDDHWYGWGIAFSKVYRLYLREYIEKH